MSQWIAVEERLPEQDQAVLVWDIDSSHSDFVDIGYYDPESAPETGWRSDEYMNKSVTHWMPLPLPPETPK